MLKEKTPSIIGWREWISFPDLKIPAIKAKVDTGARTTAIHAYFVETRDIDGIEIARFGVHPLRKRPDVEIICEAPVIDKRVVTDSGGRSELRYVIRTKVQLGNEVWPIEVTLASRESMLFRCLIGRTALSGRHIIDPQRSFVFGRSLRNQYRGWPSV